VKDTRGDENHVTGCCIETSTCISNNGVQKDCVVGRIPRHIVLPLADVAAQSTTRILNLA
jgi:hypothetical protein